MLTDIQIPTMLILIITACVSLAVSVGWVTWKDDSDGLRTWAVSLCLHAAGYSLLAVRGVVYDFLPVIVSSVLLSASYSLRLLAVFKFRSQPPEWAMLWLPPVVLTAASMLMLDNAQGRTIMGNGIFFLQGFFVCRQLASDKTPAYVRGRNLVLLGLGSAMVVTFSRMAATLAWPGDVGALFETGNVQVAVALAVFVSIILASNGFVLMAKERSDDHLRTVALKDKLTGCWNRIRIEEIAQQEMARLKRYGHPASLVMVDLDNFKDINDQYGHAVGDAILRGFGSLAQAAVRSTDVVGRWGGEEFVAVLPSTGFSEAYWVAEKMRRQLENRAFPGGYRITASFGVASCRSTDAWGDWFGRADKAMYRAKEAGRNRTKVEDLEIGEGGPVSESAPVTQLLWRRSYESGNEEIDRQHKGLLALVNGFLLAGVENSDKAYVLQVVSQLLAEGKAHFSNEELILRASGYEAVEEHARHHHLLLQRADELVNLFILDKIGVPELFHFVIYELTAQHMLIEDRKFQHVFKKQADGSVKTRAPEGTPR